MMWEQCAHGDNNILHLVSLHVYYLWIHTCVCAEVIAYSIFLSPLSTLYTEGGSITWTQRSPSELVQQVRWFQESQENFHWFYLNLPKQTDWLEWRVSLLPFQWLHCQSLCTPCRLRGKRAATGPGVLYLDRDYSLRHWHLRRNRLSETPFSMPKYYQQLLTEK